MNLHPQAGTSRSQSFRPYPVFCGPPDCTGSLAARPLESQHRHDGWFCLSQKGVLAFENSAAHRLAPPWQVHSLPCNTAHTGEGSLPLGLSAVTGRRAYTKVASETSHSSCRTVRHCRRRTHFKDMQKTCLNSSHSPAEMDPQPMRRQCFSTLRDRAIFSFTLVQTGDVSCSFARSPFTWGHTAHSTSPQSHSSSPRDILLQKECAGYHPNVIDAVHNWDAVCGLARRLTATTRAPVHMDPMLSMSTSFFTSFPTLPCFSPPCIAHGGLSAAMP